MHTVFIKTSGPVVCIIEPYSCIIVHKNFSGFQGMTKLRYLDLSDNSLTGNNIFESLGKLPSLEVINIHSSSVGGALQDSG